MVDELYDMQYRLVTNVMGISAKTESPEMMVEAWAEGRKTTVDQTEQMLADMRATGTPDIAMMAVAIHQLRRLVGG